MIGINVSGLDHLLAKLDAVGGALQKKQLAEVWAQAGVTVLKRHFRRLDAEYPNKFGGIRTHFWRAVGDTVQKPVVGPALISIAINHPIIAHKAGLGPAGGVIVPKEKKWLAIPVVKEAYGLSPISYETGGSSDRKLMFVKFSDLKAGLLEVIAAKGPKGGKRYRLVYALRKQVIQKAFPDALPKNEDFEKEIAKATDDYLAALPALAK